MKYKILKGTELFDKLSNLHNRIEDARMQINKALKKIGYEKYAISRDYLVNCGAIVIYGEKPDGFRKVGDCFYYPTVKNKEVSNIINALPSIRNDELNTIVDFHWQVTGNLAVYERPAFFMSENCALIEVGEDCKYTPLPDMIEITGSEFKSLIEEKKAEV